MPDDQRRQDLDRRSARFRPVYAAQAIAALVLVTLPMFRPVTYFLDESSTETDDPGRSFAMLAFLPAVALLILLVVAGCRVTSAAVPVWIAVLSAAMAILFALFRFGVGMDHQAPALTVPGTLAFALVVGVCAVGIGHWVVVRAEARAALRELNAGSRPRAAAALPHVEPLPDEDKEATPKEPSVTADDDAPPASAEETSQHGEAAPDEGVTSGEGPLGLAEIGVRYARFYVPLLVGSALLAFVPWYADADINSASGSQHVSYGTVFTIAVRPGGHAMAFAIVLVALLVAVLAAAVFRPVRSASRPAAVAFAAFALLLVIALGPGTGTPAPPLGEGAAAGLALLVLDVLVGTVHAVHLLTRRYATPPRPVDLAGSDRESDRESGAALVEPGVQE